MAKQTVKILNLQGGGIRGYMSATFLARFCTQAGINPNQLYNAFDLITGTSIGGIQALGYANGKAPSDLLSYMNTNAETIFAPYRTPAGGSSYRTTMSALGISRNAYLLYVLSGLWTASPWYGYNFSFTPSTPPGAISMYSLYSNTGLQTVLTDALGSETLLSGLPGKVIITSWDIDESIPVLFSNITNFPSLLTGANQNAVNVGLCTSAAPLYFPIVTMSGHQYIDGGVFQNNPVETAFSVARQLYPTATRFCILSVGTGTSNFPISFSTDTLAPSYNVQYTQYLSSSVFIPGPQQAAQNQMALDSLGIYDDIFTYQFQYQFQAGQDASMDNPDSSNLTALAGYANAQYDTDAVQIANFIAHFNADMS